ncbi:hypothetical protein WBJ53_25015 [Spirosoma sp. SC4-14]|uniref:hypothetical protein n=1 Tax=Spirosoma sp. SC4-14 TaxID=3128900 RepID=UPI0030CEBA95
MAILHKSLILTLVLVSTMLFSCSKSSKDPDPQPSAEQLIADKWWCPSGSYAQQFFGSDGSWQQRLQTTDTPDTGKWSFSADKKTINISEVKGGSTPQLFSQWSYTVNKLETAALNINYSGLAISYTPCP